MDLKSLDLTINDLLDVVESTEDEDTLRAVKNHPHCSEDLRELICSRIYPSEVSGTLSKDQKIVEVKGPRGLVEDVEAELDEEATEEVKALRTLSIEKIGLVGKRVRSNYYEFSLGSVETESFDFSSKRQGQWAFKPVVMATILSVVTLSAEAKNLSRQEQLAQELAAAGFVVEPLKKAPEGDKKAQDESPKSRLEQQAEELRRAGFDVKVKK